MAVSVNKNLAASYILEDPLGRIANDGRVSNLGRVGKNGYVDSRFAPNFDGVDDFGTFASLISIAANADFDIEFKMQSSLDTSFNGVLSQNTTNTTNNFLRFMPDSQPHNLQMIFADGTSASLIPRTGGSSAVVRNGVLNKVRIARVSGVVTPYLNDVAFASLSRSAALEFGILCRLGSTYFSGLFFDLKINGVLWRMDQRNQAIQPSTPAGNSMTLVNVTSDRWQEVPQ